MPATPYSQLLGAGSYVISLQLAVDNTVVVGGNTYKFLRWTETNEVTPTITVNLSADTTRTAEFEPVSPAGSYLLTIESGTNGQTYPSTSGYYPTGTVVAVYAMPDAGYTLDRWILDGAEVYVSPVIMTMDAPHTLTPYFKSNSSLTPFHRCNALLDNVYQNIDVSALSWLYDATGVTAEVVVVNDGDVLPDGQIATTIEGGKCLRHMSGWDTTVTPPVRAGYGFYSTYANGLSNWDFRYTALFKVRMLTNHPESSLKWSLFTGEGTGWTAFSLVTLPEGSMPANQWVEISVDMRMPLEGVLPALNLGKGIGIFTYTPNANTDYTLTDFMAVDVAPGAGPLEYAISPMDVYVNIGQAVTFSISITGGTPPYVVNWYDFDTDNLLVTGTTMDVVPSVAKIYRYYAIITDSSTPVQQLKTAVATLNAVSKYHSLVVDANISSIPVTYRRLS